MTDPLTTQTHTEALEELLAAADALLSGCRDYAAAGLRSHMQDDEDDLRRAVASARAVLNAEQAA